MSEAEKRLEEIDSLRKAMGTFPEDNPPREDKIYYGLKHLMVELVDYPHNPYRAIYEMVTSTWAGREKWWRRWENATIDGRIAVVTAALARKSLPQALEAATFVFKVQGLTRGSFDHFARHRHAGVGSVGSRDNNHLDAALVIPKTFDTPFWQSFYEKWWKETKDAYAYLVAPGQHNWQNARAVLPMSMEWRFTWCLNFRGMQDVCMQRLVFCEQWDTVGAAWAMREAIKEKFPLLAAFLRPGCDWAGKCTYSQTYSLSELFGCLFAPCGRHKRPDDAYTYATFNESCTDVNEIQGDLGINIPEPADWEDIVTLAIEKDREFFE